MSRVGKVPRGKQGEVAIDQNPHPEVDAARCSGCGRCIAACTERLFTLEVTGFRKHAVLIAPQRCTRCLECLPACPVGALGCESPSPTDESAGGSGSVSPAK